MADDRAKPVVLVVEDDPTIRAGAIAMIEDAGFEAVHADSSDDAVDILVARGDITAVFSDVEIPGTFSGFELAATIHENWPNVRVIVTSGVTLPDGRELPDGIPFLPKPYTPDALLTRLRG